jgi:hypothetical protein
VTASFCAGVRLAGDRQHGSWAFVSGASGVNKGSGSEYEREKIPENVILVYGLEVHGSFMLNMG